MSKDEIVIISVLFPPGKSSDSARRILARMGIKPVPHGGRRQDGWLQYPINEPTSTIPSSRQEVSLGELVLYTGIKK